MAVVEYVVGIQTRGVGVESGELHAFRLPIGRFAEAAGLAYREVAGVADIDEVAAQHRAVKAEVEFGCFGGRFGMTDVEGVTQENPSPTDVRSDLETRGGGYVQRLCVSGCIGGLQAIHLIEVGVLHHGREVVIVRTDVGGVVFVKALDEACKDVGFFLDFLPERSGVFGRTHTVGDTCGQCVDACFGHTGAVCDLRIGTDRNEDQCDDKHKVTHDTCR